MIPSISPSTIASPSSSATSASSSAGLVKMANGEYSAASVSKDPTDAAKLGLVKEKDGNYGTSAQSQVMPPSTKSTAPSSSVSAALSALTLGGA